MKSRVIALSGGIGSGKSMVSRVLRIMGYPVYDTDAEARQLMEESAEIKERLSREITPTAVRADGELDRRAIAAAVFGDREKLQRLNAIVHPAVKADLRMRIERTESPIFFFETALLGESGLDALADEVWHIEAPATERLERVMRRNGLTRKEVHSRMASQDTQPPRGAKIIVNDGKRALLPQVIGALG